MESIFCKSIVKYFRIFFYFGQTKYSKYFALPEAEKNQNQSSNCKYWKKLAANLPVFVFGLLNVILTSLALVNQPEYNEKFSDPNNVVGYIFIGFSFLTNSMIITQHFRTIDLVYEFFVNLEAIGQILKDKYSVNISFRMFRRIFLTKIGLIIGSYLQLLAMCAIGSVFLKRVIICPYSFGLSAMTDLSCVYAVFCIDLISKILSEINTILVKEEKIRCILRNLIEDDADSLKMLEIVVNLKRIYLKLIPLAQKLNDYFGWFFIAYIIQHFIDLASDLFWLFLINHDNFDYKMLFIISYLVGAATSVVILINSSECCTTEARQISSNLLRLTLTNRNSDNLHAEKHEFLQQLFNQPIEISAKGFFTLNRQFLATLSTACCTYVIILLQFQFQVPTC